MSQQNLSDNSAVENSKLSVEDTVSFLSEDDTPEEVIELEDKKAAKSSKDKADELDDKSSSDKQDSDDSDDKSIEDEIEEELDEESKEFDEDELEVVVPVRRKEILAKYPNVFKDFPQLEQAYYREQKYSEILPTIDDAKEAVEKRDLLNQYETEIMSGSTESLLTAVRDGDKEAFARLVDNYLPNLHKVDEGAYFHIVGNIIKHTITAMVRDGKENDAEDLISAAQIINEYTFGTKKFTPPARLSKDEINNDKNQAESKIKEREQAFAKQQFDVAQSTLGTRVDNIVTSTIDKNIDPNNSMTDYVKRNASREVKEALESAIQGDTRFMTVFDRLWEKAANDNYSSESMDRIKSAYLSKAKTILPDLIKRSRSEALKGLSRRANNENEDKSKKGPLPVGKSRSSASSQNGGKSQVNGKSPVPKGMSSLEYLMQD